MASFPAALLLALAGGCLDAFAYLNHGHVFAGAQTWNAVFLGIAILAQQWRGVVFHAIPLVSFIAGIWLAKELERHLKEHAVEVGLAGEIVVLLGLSFLPGRFPEPVFVALLGLASAYQVGSFRKADKYVFNSTFITANIRVMVDGLFLATHPEGDRAKRRAGWRQFHELGWLMLSFVAGALGGTLLAPRFYNHTLWFAVVPLLAVLAMVLMRNYGPAQQRASRSTLR